MDWSELNTDSQTFFTFKSIFNVCMSMYSWCPSPVRSPDCIRYLLRIWTQRTVAGRHPRSQPITAEGGQSRWGKWSHQHPRHKKSRWTCSMPSYLIRFGNIDYLQTHTHTLVQTQTGSWVKHNTTFFFIIQSCRWQPNTGICIFHISSNWTFFFV